MVFCNINFTPLFLNFNFVLSRHPKVFLEKDVLKISSKSIGEHLCRSVISINLLGNFIEITLRHGCSPVNLLHTFRTPFSKIISGGWFVRTYGGSDWFPNLQYCLDDPDSVMQKSSVMGKSEINQKLFSFFL